ncbi:hypothetical protein A3K48_03730 [candidate division WOR-1 bacterium RIFOXYA12_FULL_52_29]|uniref:Ion-translocating oxidoreductase complex subunit D n=1 Tax=candidate division WOR-1 bacterium RIFOXYC12_FULL_54_18 TaxID=1802584 RepID=A0A1F4T6A1_UNCSA|nr:MAG: hypothetical protein A3K44_03730 [candidate division WOR-1 bacterium RIFOXYA2_FULL_51_19]OGC17670.1 MAG: hypothetical protein A3K48_03730 [candidate division WOR-1 bacterium RIFOXYA12_FULL_52_29]OGC26527.1 MAG: hypothetical protein A3K32_03725 [candidate division WOR-1 bacterium RIFOXYB2_FULL_45_9]OGC28087.1 MAG: hypothetical protein A3K49_03730 [candidate division WOR-1 bacterium RIFOXYC12_FULL_54_18]OGC29627.1 MAG: hypothetical protein A2346_02605 [candidate division WOR-1 bacterium R
MPINENNLIIQNGPHLRDAADAKSLMRWFAVSLIFPVAAGTFFFGFQALLLVAVTAVSAVAAEAAFQRLAKQKVTIDDGSALITGVLLALVLPPTFPLWMAAVGAVFSVVVVKCLFGGLGFNIFNPALAGRAFLMASWPVAMTLWTRPFDSVTTASPLYLARIGENVPGYLDLFLGNRAGSLGETSILMILLAAAFLVWKKVIDWPAPVAFIGTVFLLSFTLGHDPLFHLLTGGVIFGAVFMVTDYVTVPVTTKGRLIFGFGCGLITVLIRFFGGFPEGVNYSILLMNIMTPVIDKYSRPRIYGEKNAKKS